MTKVFFIGVNHFDPFGPSRAREAIQELLNQGVTIDNVYTEWDEDTAKTLISERESFRRYIDAHANDKLNPTTIDFIVKTLAYEADVFSLLIPDAKVIWLDEGRKIKSLEGYFKFRLDVIIQEFAFTRTDPNNLEIL